MSEKKALYISKSKNIKYLVCINNKTQQYEIYDLNNDDRQIKDKQIIKKIETLFKKKFNSIGNNAENWIRKTYPENVMTVTEFDEKYTKIQIGEGKDSIVYKIRKRTTGEIYASKVLKIDDIIIEGDEESQKESIAKYQHTIDEKFNEIKIMQKIKDYSCKHHVVCIEDFYFVYELNGDNGIVLYLYIIEDYISGGSLRFIFDQNEPKTYLSSKQIQTLAISLFESVAFLHKIGIYHQDLHLNNILFKFSTIRTISQIDFNNIFVVDYGLSIFKSMDISFMQYLRIIHSPQIRDIIYKEEDKQYISKYPDYIEKNDIWALCVILFEIITFKDFIPNVSYLFEYPEEYTSPYESSYLDTAPYYKENSYIINLINRVLFQKIKRDEEGLIVLNIPSAMEILKILDSKKAKEIYNLEK